MQYIIAFKVLQFWPIRLVFISCTFNDNVSVWWTSINRIDDLILWQRRGWKTIRLFVSSTFRDMGSEREFLVKRVFPELRIWCEDRKLRLVDIDLRWGVPKDADSRETLLTCLSEIDRYRQYIHARFILIPLFALVISSICFRYFSRITLTWCVYFVGVMRRMSSLISWTCCLSVMAGYLGCRTSIRILWKSTSGFLSCRWRLWRSPLEPTGHETLTLVFPHDIYFFAKYKNYHSHFRSFVWAHPIMQSSCIFVLLSGNIYVQEIWIFRFVRGYQNKNHLCWKQRRAELVRYFERY